MASDVLLTYLPVGILLALSVLIAVVMLSIGRILGAPRNPNPLKLGTYECGEVPMGPARTNIDVQYYLYILVFLVLDVEVAFLVPFAMNFVKMPGALLVVVDMVLFVGLLLIGWAYAWKKGALAWSR
ncbi:MAG: NADH-quinone oxidoreductase subunit A [Halobacteriales archaeon]|nr:NADH-quinone oxidoreductase subunit A [Halobacteriales archaeon]